MKQNPDQRNLLAIASSISRHLASSSSIGETAKVLVDSIHESFKFTATVFYRLERVTLAPYYTRPEQAAKRLDNLGNSYSVIPLCVLSDKKDWSTNDCSGCLGCDSYLSVSLLRRVKVTDFPGGKTKLNEFATPVGHGLKPVLIVPIGSWKTLFGALAMFTDKDRKLSQSEEFCLTIISNNAALAFKGNDLAEVLEAIGREESRGEIAREVVHTLTPEISSLAIEANLLRKSVDQISKHLGDKQLARQNVNSAIKALDAFTEGIFHQQNLLRGYEGVAQKEDDVVTEVSLSKIMYDVLSINESRANRKKITFNATVIGSEREIRGTEMDVYLIIWNLVNNAVKFTRGNRSSKIHLTLTFETRTITLSVRDEGVGISEANRPFIWQHGFSTAAPDVDRTTGGIGLATVNKLIKTINADIQVRSKVNSGSEFTLIIRQ